MRVRALLVVAAICTLAWCGRAVARSQYLSAWQARYPGSTLPSRMSATLGSQCYTCHHPSSFGGLGNCYRLDLIARLMAGRTITQAIDDLDTVDSDGDGTPNGQEILMPRPDLPGQIGYSMGLAGPVGVDPCWSNPNQAVTGVPETPPPPAVTGDCDGNGVFELLADLPCFLDVLLGVNIDPGAIGRSDLNGDGRTDGRDVAVFVECAIGGCP